MYIKNNLASYLSLNVCGKNWFLAPAGKNGDTAIIPDVEPFVSDMSLQMMIKQGTVSNLDAKDAEKKFEERVVEVEEKPAMKVVSANEVKKQQSVIVKCAGKTAKGTDCRNNVTIPALEYDGTRAYFCGRHSNENPDDYVKVDGKWEKKLS